MITEQEIQKQMRHLQVAPGEQFIRFMEHWNEAAADEKGHITASGMIVRIPSREVLLLHHKILDRWLIPGGHAEPDDKSLVGVALREIEEETGLAPERLMPVNKIGNTQYCVEIDSHLIPLNEKKNEPAHWHHDFRFVFIYTNYEEIKIDTNESIDYKWLSIDNGYIRKMMGEQEFIDPLLLATLEKYEQTHRENYHNDYLVTPLASYLFRLAKRCYLRGAKQEAEQKYKQAIKAFRDTYNDEYETPPGILAAYWNLALIYKEQEHYNLELQILTEGLRQAEEFAQIDENFSSEAEAFRELYADCKNRLPKEG